MNCTTGSLIRKRGILGLVLFAVIGFIPAKPARAVELFWNTDGFFNSWLATNWGTSAGGPFTTDWTSSDDAHFTVNSFLAADNVTFGSIAVDANAVVTVTAVAGTEMGTGGTIATIDVGADGALDLSDGTVQNISNLAGTGFLKNGDGILSMGGTPLAGTAYDGGFTLNAGVVIMRTNNTLGTGPLTINGGTIMGTSASGIGTRTPASSSITIGGDFTLGGETTILNSTNGSPNFGITLPVAVDLTGGDRKVTIGANATYTISGSISNGALTVAANSGATGTLVLSNGGSTFSDGVTVSSGTLILNANSTPLSGIVTSGPVGTGILTLSGGNLTATGGTRTIANTIEIAAGTTSNIFGSSNNFLLTGALTGSGTIDNTLDTANVSNSISFNGDLSGFSGTIIHNRIPAASGVGTDTYRFNGSTDESQDGSHAKFVLNGSTDISTGGTLFRVVTQDGGTFQMGELSGDGNVIRNDLEGMVPGQQMTLEVGHLDSDTSWGGVYWEQPTMTSHFTKVGSGILTLTGNSTYTGVTNVNEGTLRVNGNPTGGGNYNVASGATLGGIGSIGTSSATVDAGGKLAPGESIGTFSVGGAVIDGALDIEFGNNSVDQLIVNGSLDLTNAVLNLDGVGDLANNSYVFLTYNSLVNGNEFLSVLNKPDSLSIVHNTIARTFAIIGEYVDSLPGDYNSDGFVNAADYVMWRDNPDGFGGIPEGYGTWKSNFGSPQGAGSSQATAVPEPSSIALLLCIVFGVRLRRFVRSA